uniref:ABC1 atypical kinase-like domain-containing protein n=1 Tax=Pyramimonas obovata TaxID=1411642 RepID=A0A7S0WUM2_9CHLO|mmetsp:Transcript_50/g.123  ORF Transcript_50/g.123 Transcript_50/m.123 type:complete len:727 (+) Transcript_50:72-2252(+)
MATLCVGRASATQINAARARPATQASRGMRMRATRSVAAKATRPLRMGGNFQRRDWRVQVATPATQKTAQEGDDSAKESAEPETLTVNTSITEEEMEQLEKAAADMSERKGFKERTLDYTESDKAWVRIKKLNAFQRTLEIWGFVVKFLFKRWKVDQKWAYKKEERGEDGLPTKAAKSASLATLATWLRENLLRLGPTFIKVGQQFSTRVDVLSPELIKELEKLQDNVPPFGIEEAKEIISSELGGDVDEKYSYFEDQPIAAASLGQVHRARIGDQEVVVKVQRPGLKQLFDYDLKNIRVLASLLQSVDPKTDGAARDWVAIYDECARILYQEIDYRVEGESADQFAENFKEMDWVKVPSIYWDYTAEKVLTMEYCPGIKINRVEELDKLGVDRKRMAKLIVEGYLLQILRYGLFHADPHPGNIAVDPKDGGKLVYYDFGMMGRLQPGVRDGLLNLFYATFERNADKAMDALVQMGVLVPTGDMTAVKRTAQFFLNSFYERLEVQSAQKATQGEEYNKDFKAPRTKEEKKARRKQILGNIGEDLLMVGQDQPFRFPAAFTFVVRAFSVLDGIGKGLDPKFDISEISRPYARELIMDGRPKYAKLQTEVVKAATAQSRALVNLFKSPDRVEELDSTVKRLQNGDLKLRVRALEAERQLAKMAVVQAAQGQGMIAAAAANIGTVLYCAEVALAANIAFGFSGLFGLMALGSIMKAKKLEKKEKALSGQ